MGHLNAIRECLRTFSKDWNPLTAPETTARVLLKFKYTESLELMPTLSMFRDRTTTVCPTAMYQYLYKIRKPKTQYRDPLYGFIITVNTKFDWHTGLQPRPNSEKPDSYDFIHTCPHELVLVF